MIKINKIKIVDNNENCENINLIIGPNNSGKTTFLREIYGSLQSGIVTDTNKWLCEFEIYCENPKQVIRELMPRVFEVENFDLIKNIRQTGYKSFSPDIITGSNYWNLNVFHESRRAQDGNETYTITKITAQNSKWFFWRFLTNSLSVNEDCEQRLQGPFNTMINNITGEQQNDFLAYLYTTPNMQWEIKKNIWDVFKIKIGFDDLQQGQKHLRLLPEHRITGQTNLPETAQKWQKESPIVEQQGHGLKAYLRLVFSLLQPNKIIVLIDEPESFLHPPQRKALGNLVAKLAIEEKKQVFIATHDSEFLRGVIAAGVRKIKIFYLKSVNKNFSYSIFDAKNIEDLIHQRSNLINERILNSFFYRKTILCEAEDDRLFYEHAASRYHWGLFQDVNFIGFNGKSDVISIFENLKSMEINTAMILDIDYISGTERFPKNIDYSELREKFSTVRKKIRDLVEKKTFDIKRFKKDGIKYIENSQNGIASDCKNLLNLFRNIGIFLVPIGEFESFVKVSHGNLQKAINIVQNTRKRELANFLEDILKK